MVGTLGLLGCRTPPPSSAMCQWGVQQGGSERKVLGCFTASWAL